MTHGDSRGYSRAFYFGNRETDIYVQQVPFHISDQELFEAAEKFGNVTRVRIVRDRTTDRGMGFGFIRAENAIEAQKILQGLNGLILGRRVLRAKPVSPPQHLEQPRSEEGTE